MLQNDETTMYILCKQQWKRRNHYCTFSINKIVSFVLLLKFYMKRTNKNTSKFFNTN